MSASAAEWIEGARIRTLPNSVAPVLVGAGAAAAIDRFSWVASLLALVVALSLQVGVNYANDYSDGIRGTDAARVGPLRLVGSGVATAASVRTAALTCFAVAAVAGVVLVALTGHWWLLAVGPRASRARGSTRAARGRTATPAGARWPCSSSSDWWPCWGPSTCRPAW